ncbi:hypothetical protein MIMGU_mgv1a017194mg [Erythranthe guttata]|uniref:Uncharacterized protein n=1 Tax=Erythranthe guttata TaxID=4155 RepID=A0A022Q781_ERYGU|nr:hypothetical protein MIMGU_mgv1a017194mg [Erythranthe guttata]
MHNRTFTHFTTLRNPENREKKSKEGVRVEIEGREKQRETMDNRLRKEQDLKELLMADFKVDTPADDMNVLFVKFHGPKDSNFFSRLVLS